MNQIQKVIKKLNKDKSVDNFWAIDNYILRLGAIIYILKKENGMIFEGSFGKKLGRKRHLWKNFYYKLVEKKTKKI